MNNSINRSPTPFINRLTYLPTYELAEECEFWLRDLHKAKTDVVNIYSHSFIQYQYKKLFDRKTLYIYLC